MMARIVLMGFALYTCAFMTHEKHVSEKDVYKTDNIADKAVSNKTLITKDSLLALAFIHVESRGNDSATNKSAAGCMQITPIMIDEANRLAGYAKYTYTDRFRRDKSILVFHDIMKHKNRDYNLDEACAIWNPGAGNIYRDSVQQAYDRLCKTYNIQNELA